MYILLINLLIPRLTHFFCDEVPVPRIHKCLNELQSDETDQVADFKGTLGFDNLKTGINIYWLGNTE